MPALPAVVVLPQDRRGAHLSRDRHAFLPRVPIHAAARKEHLPRRHGKDGRLSGPGRDREKYSALARVDSVNGVPPGQAKARPDFDELTPVYPRERLRLESGSASPTARIIDLVSPVGKGQRGLIVFAPKAGIPRCTSWSCLSASGQKRPPT